MNYYEARQRKGDSRWDYSCRNDDMIWPVGYCGAYRAWTDDDFKRLGFSKEDPQIKKGAEFAAKHHTDGHATAEEANACYKEYLLDQQLRFGQDDSQQRKCQVCEAWTSCFAEVGPASVFMLCDAHLNRESVASLLTVGITVSSW